MVRILAYCLVLLTARCVGQSSEQWGKLLDAGKYAEAKSLCTRLSHSSSGSTRVEAEKCLANVALCQGTIVSLQGNDTVGGSLGTGYRPEAVDEALKHLDLGIKLAPQDLSIHQGRLHVLEVSGRFPEMIQALDESATVYRGTDALEHWLAYDAELGEMGQAKAGLAFAEVLNKHYPNSHDVIGNIGAFHNMLKEPDKALPFLRQAVELAPKDAIDNWNLGWTFDHLGRTDEANLWMSKAIQLDPDGRDVPGRNCLYAEFVEKKLKQVQRACQLETASCEVERRMACKNQAGSGSGADRF